MDLSKIRELLRIVAESEVAEVEIEQDGYKVVVRKNSPTVMIQPPALSPYGMNFAPYPYPQAPVQPVQPASSAAPASNPVHNHTPVTSPAEPDTLDKGEETGNEAIIRAPIVGTFYRAPAPDAAPFVQVGDSVKQGDILCIIEAMKLMNEIECETPGIIKRILVQNAEAVEYDQPLFVIEPL